MMRKTKIRDRTNVTMKLNSARRARRCAVSRRMGCSVVGIGSPGRKPNRPWSTLTRKMFCQQFTGLLHAVNDACRKFGFAEITGHGLRQLPPEFVSALDVNTLVTDDGELVRARCHKNQHTIPFGRLVQAQAHKFHLRGRHRLVHVMGADAHMDLTGRLVFGVTNRRHDVVVVHLLCKILRMHKLPASSRAAAAKAAATSRESAAAAKAPAAAETTTAPSAGTATAAHRPDRVTGAQKSAPQEDRKYKQDYGDGDNRRENAFHTPHVFRHGRSVSLVLAFDGRENGVYPRRQAAV